jgi:hypothetical protein
MLSSYLYLRYRIKPTNKGSKFLETSLEPTGNLEKRNHTELKRANKSM